MASVNYDKLKTKQEIKARIKHIMTDSRLKQNHTNKQINKSLTPENIMFGPQTTDELYNKIYDRIYELDKTTNKNKRKDRVNCFSLEYPLPENLEPEKRNEWILKTIDILKNQYGEKNFMGGSLHVDEKHEYLDAETKEMRESRDHVHFMLIPEVEGQLNGKKFSSKKNMIQLNDMISRMTEEDYGLTFNTGTKKKSNKEVEELKAESRKLEIENKLSELQDLSLQVQEKYNKTKEAEKENDRKEALNDRKEVLNNKKWHSLNEKENVLNERNERLNRKEGFLNHKENDLNIREDDLNIRKINLKRQIDDYVSKKAAELSNLYINTTGAVLDRLKAFSGRFKVGNKTIYEMFEESEKRKETGIKETQENKKRDYEKELAEKLRKGSSFRTPSQKTDDFEF